MKKDRRYSSRLDEKMDFYTVWKMYHTQASFGGRKPTQLSCFRNDVPKKFKTM